MIQQQQTCDIILEILPLNIAHIAKTKQQNVSRKKKESKYNTASKQEEAVIVVGESLCLLLFKLVIFSSTRSIKYPTEIVFMANPMS